VADDTSTNQIVLDYTSRDFDAIRAMMVGIGQGVFPEWVTLGEPGDFGTLLIELFAHTSDVLNFYIDRVGSEAFLGTAQLRRSVLYIADQFGYTPIGQQAATAILRVSLGADEAIFTIPAGTRVSTSGEIQATFETDMDLTLFPGQSDIPLLATEGLTVSGASLGLSKGIPNAEFILPDKGVIYRTVGIQTLEAGQLVDWSYVENVVLARPTQSAFSTYVDDEGFTHVIFGDNAAGRIPPTNVEIRASYRFGIGAKANEIPPGEINTLEPSALTGSIPATLSVSNYDHPLGGADPESVETMRFSIPRTSNTQHRAVTLNDYVSLTMQVPGSGKAIADNSGILPDGDSDLTDGLTEMGRLRALVSASLEDKKLLGSHVFVEDVWQKDNQGWEDIVISLDVHVLSGFNRAQTVDRVRTAVLALVDFNAVDFGQRISIGQVYRAATGVEGVDYVVLTEMHGNTVEANASGLVSDVHTPRKKIPRLRPEILDGNLVTQEQGLSVTGYGGLVT
jgi:hypothetical protein